MSHVPFSSDLHPHASVQDQGTLLMVVAPSGAGKTSLVTALLAQDPCLVLSISHTTRLPRSGEINGQAYHFVNEKVFLDMQSKGIFLESALVHDHYYGTSRTGIDEAFKAGQDVLLEIDWQGAQQVRKVYPYSISIFILPPSYEVLEQRLLSRGQDDAATIKRRMLNAKEELRHIDEFDYAIVNDDFSEALEQLRAIVQVSRLRCFVQRKNRH